MKNLSLGEKRMRISLSTPRPGNTYAIKSRAAEMIDILEDFRNDERNGIDAETSRLVSVAQTDIEKAVEMAEKAVSDNTYSEKDLVSFGNYLLSETREKRLISIGGLTTENMHGVDHEDLENWKEQQ